MKGDLFIVTVGSPNVAQPLSHIRDLVFGPIFVTALDTNVGQVNLGPTDLQTATLKGPPLRRSDVVNLEHPAGCDLNSQSVIGPNTGDGVSVYIVGVSRREAL